MTTQGNGQLVMAIDTASPTASVALGNENGLLAETSWNVETTISKELLAQIDLLLSTSNTDRHALSALAICIGPGSYGSLRAGIATVQGIALALDVPLATIPRLEADAAPYLINSPEKSTVVAIHNAGRVGIAWAAYTFSQDSDLLIELVPPSITSLDECVMNAPQDAMWCGEIPELLTNTLAQSNRTDDVIAAPMDHVRAVTILELARKRNNYDDPALASALYLRPPSITRPKPKQATSNTR
tara:strand:- start:1983 stop:2711 length:729 start_codon:yes stop_codon:yes gene_type:complete